MSTRLCSRQESKGSTTWSESSKHGCHRLLAHHCWIWPRIYGLCIAYDPHAVLVRPSIKSTLRGVVSAWWLPQHWLPCLPCLPYQCVICGAAQMSALRFCDCDLVLLQGWGCPCGTHSCGGNVSSCRCARRTFGTHLHTLVIISIYNISITYLYYYHDQPPALPPASPWLEIYFATTTNAPTRAPAPATATATTTATATATATAATGWPWPALGGIKPKMLPWWVVMVLVLVLGGRARGFLFRTNEKSVQKRVPHFSAQDIRARTLSTFLLDTPAKPADTIYLIWFDHVWFDLCNHIDCTSC